MITMNNKISYYESILSKSSHVDFLTPARQTINHFEESQKENSTLVEVTSLVTAPVLLAYTSWVLLDACKRGLRRLYFLARDGYIMYNMALSLCKAWGIDMECRYFYCSRYILRLPIFLYDRERTLDWLFSLSAYSPPTAIMVMLRAGISYEDAIKVLSGINWQPEEELNYSNLKTLRKDLIECQQFIDLAMKAAKEAERQVRGYLIQECGDTASVPFALVDSGWNGSSQECFYRIYTAIFDTPLKLEGYYFGMHVNGNPQFGVYHCWLFSPGRKYFRMQFINLNLFECLCMADHGMTMGYEERDDKWVPVFFENTGYFHSELQNTVCEMYINNFMEINAACGGTINFDRNVYSLLKSFMVHPSGEEAVTYGSIEFGDDPTGKIIGRLAEPININEYWQQSFYKRLFVKLIGRKTTVKHFLWLDGALTLSKHSFLVKLDMLLLRILTHLRLSLKNWKQ